MCLHNAGSFLRKLEYDLRQKDERSRSLNFPAASILSHLYSIPEYQGPRSMPMSVNWNPLLGHSERVIFYLYASEYND